MVASTLTRRYDRSTAAWWMTCYSGYASGGAAYWINRATLAATYWINCATIAVTYWINRATLAATYWINRATLATYRINSARLATYRSNRAKRLPRSAIEIHACRRVSPACVLKCRDIDNPIHRRTSERSSEYHRKAAVRGNFHRASGHRAKNWRVV